MTSSPIVLSAFFFNSLSRLCLRLAVLEPSSFRLDSELVLLAAVDTIHLAP